MHSIVVWQGLEYNSQEYCEICEGEDGMSIAGHIAGCYNDVLYKITYDIRTDKYERTSFAGIRSSINGTKNETVLQCNESGEWLMNGKPVAYLNGCIDVDIPLTPSTNTLPIRRLKLSVGREAITTVVYIDLLAATIKPVSQLYRRAAPDVYHYENIPNDFMADIVVDEEGLVVHYPYLFDRAAGRSL